VRDTSLRVPPGVEGTIINVRIFSRKGLGKDERSKAIEDEEITRLRKDQHDEVRILQEGALKRLKKLLVGRRLAVRLSDDGRKILLNKGKSHGGRSLISCRCPIGAISESIMNR
jgi:DNA-directed RNA polymerase subunit beta